MLIRELVRTGLVAAAVVVTPLSGNAGEAGEGAVKFAFYSASWQENTRDPLRVVAFNPLDTSVRIESIDFVDIEAPGGSLELSLQLDVPAGGYAELEMEYVDLLGQGECIGETLAGDWRLVEISNYTLNPSVRNLIIENTESFRIYQCVQTVETRITEAATGASSVIREWVLYHFESLSER
ncbi:MAG: hypothetical protein F4Y89_12015 [Gammaproteobacteria bacterium]|nr:hypothetical protein [Gammaproteobacteria bacterium]MYG97794.1 hypothetical protein [Gammaproteobacteria bacterium]